MMIHLTRAVTLSVLGAFLATEFKVFSSQRDRVTKRESLPGMWSGGTAKLIWEKDQIDKTICWFVLCSLTQEIATNDPVGNMVSKKYWAYFRSRVISNLQ